MLVKMTRTEKGSPDGVSVREFTKGEVYDLPDSLADVFVNEMECADQLKSTSKTITVVPGLRFNPNLHPQRETKVEEPFETPEGNQQTSDTPENQEQQTSGDNPEKRETPETPEHIDNQE